MKAIEDLKKIIDEANGIFSYDFERTLNGEFLKYHIIVNNTTTLLELSSFLVDLEMWRFRNGIHSFQISIVKE